MNHKPRRNRAPLSYRLNLVDQGTKRPEHTRHLESAYHRFWPGGDKRYGVVLSLDPAIDAKPCGALRDELKVFANHNATRNRES